MKKNKIVLFYTPEDEELTKVMHKGIEEYSLDEANEIDVITYVKEFNLPLLELYSFPKAGLEESILDAVKKDFLSKSSRLEKAKFKIIFTDDVRAECLKILKSNKYDLAVCTIRKRDAVQKIFSSSFIDNIIERSSTDLLVIK